jgi:hypothetical protein
LLLEGSNPSPTAFTIIFVLWFALYGRKKKPLNCGFLIDASLRFELRLKEPKTLVLPLHHEAKDPF